METLNTCLKTSFQGIAYVLVFFWLSLNFCAFIISAKAFFKIPKYSPLFSSPSGVHLSSFCFLHLLCGRKQVNKKIKIFLRKYYWRLTIYKLNESFMLFYIRLIHIWGPEKLSNFQDPPPPLSIYVRSSSTPLTMDVQFQTNFLLQRTTKQQLQRAFEQTKSKQKQNKVTSHSNWPRVLFFDLAHKQCNGINKWWLYCLTSELKGRFLVNSILMFGSACLVMAQIHFSLIKKWRLDVQNTRYHPTPYIL